MIHKPSCPEHRNVSASHAGCSRLPRSRGGQSVVGRQIVVWQHEIDRNWGSLRFRTCEWKPTEITTYSKSKSIGANSARTRCDLTSTRTVPAAATLLEMKSEGPSVYRATVPKTRPAGVWQR